MKYQITGINLEVTDGLKDAIYKSMRRLERYFQEDTLARITMRVVKGQQIIEVTIPLKKNPIRTEQSSQDMYISIDLAAEVLERQMKKYRKKLVDQYQSGTFKRNFEEEEGVMEEDTSIIISRVKTFENKPMTPEEACLEMEMSGHIFFAFVNAETEKVSVVYKRSNGTYGMLEPEA